MFLYTVRKSAPDTDTWHRSLMALDGVLMDPVFIFRHVAQIIDGGLDGGEVNADI